MIFARPKNLFVVVALIAFHAGAQPITSYSTFGPGNSYSNSAGWLVNGSANPPQPYVAEAFSFTPTASGFLSQLNLAICAGNTNLASDRANIFIAANSGQNLPGLTLESFLNVPCTGTFGLDNPLLSLNSSVQPYLQSGGTYWLWVQAATPQAAIIVNQNNIGLLAPQAQSFSPSSWSARGSKSTFGFDVVVVPEPSLGAIAVLGLAVIICRKFSHPV
jgi:hypothetical protein